MSIAELPEVQALLEQRWELAPDAPFLVFLPAVWPTLHRTWINDRSTHMMVYTVDGESTELPWSPEVEEMNAADLQDLCDLAGVAGWAPGRVWLLRGPARRRVSNIVEEMIVSAEASGIAPAATPEFADHVRRIVARAFSD